MAATPECEVKIEPPIHAAKGRHTGPDQVKITYQVFKDIPQPQPGPGPLAEVIRALIDLSPEPLRAEQLRLEQLLLAQLGEDPVGLR